MKIYYLFISYNIYLYKYVIYIYTREKEREMEREREREIRSLQSCPLKSTCFCRSKSYSDEEQCARPTNTARLYR